MTNAEINRILKRHADNGDDNARALLGLRTGDPATVAAHRNALKNLRRREED